MTEQKYFTEIKDGLATESVLDKMFAGFKTFNNEWIEIIVRKKKRRISLSQRGYYFAAIVACFQQGAQEEWGEYIDKATAHENLKKFCNYKEIVTEDGAVEKITMSTKDFDTYETEQYHERCRRLIFDFFGIVTPLPNEQTEAFLNK